MLIHRICGKQPTESNTYSNRLWCEQQNLNMGKNTPEKPEQCRIQLQTCHPQCLTSFLCSRENVMLYVLFTATILLSTCIYISSCHKETL